MDGDGRTLKKGRAQSQSASSTQSNHKTLIQRRRHSSSAIDKPLNTHSPVALAAAAAVTPAKIAALLHSQGPLAIRHITAHLAQTIPGFGGLSLSKQRRVIVGVLDSGDPKIDVRFSKVGWGRWAVEQDARSSRSASMDGAKLLLEADRRVSTTSRPPIPRLSSSPEESAIVSDDDDSDNLEEPILGEHTDEEDWASLGPDSLRDTTPREQDAVAALVKLRAATGVAL